MMGTAFRRLRQREGASLKDVSSGIVSLGALSKFEGGQADMPINKLVAMLARLGVSLQEFVSSFDPLVGNAQSLMPTVNRMSATGDAAGLRSVVDDLQKRYMRRWTPLDFQKLILAAGAYYNRTQNNVLDVDQMTTLNSWFNDGIRWTEANVISFRYSCVLLPGKTVYRVALDLFGRLQDIYAVNHSLNVTAWEAILSAESWLIRSSDITLARRLDAQVQTGAVTLNTLLVAYRRDFVSRCLAYRVAPSPESAVRVTALIDFLRAIGSQDLANTYCDSAAQMCGVNLYANVTPKQPGTDAVREAPDEN